MEDWGMSDSMNRCMHSMNRGSMDRGMYCSSMMGRGRSIVGNTFIGYINNIATVGISSVVVDHLDSAVRESNSVGSRSGVAISLLIMAELGTTVVICNTILEGIVSRLFITGLRSVARCRGHAKGSSQQTGQNDDSLKT